MIKYLTNNEIAINDYATAMALSEILLNNDYVVMISREEQLYIINYIWSFHNSDRNDVCFQDREVIEEIIFNQD